MLCYPRNIRHVFICGILVTISVLVPRSVLASEFSVPSERVVQDRLSEFAEFKNRSIVEFQPFRAAQQVSDPDGNLMELLSVNAHHNMWFLLEIDVDGVDEQFHLELASPKKTKISLDNQDGAAILFEDEMGLFRCKPWAGKPNELSTARGTGLPYAPICNKKAFLRNAVDGNRSSREAVAEFLRDNVMFGESLISMIKGTFYEDAYMSSGAVQDGGTVEEVASALGVAKLSSRPKMNSYFGFEVDTKSEGMKAGAWYPIVDGDGIYASAVQPGMIDPDILSIPGANGLDEVESRADVFLVAFDLAKFDLGYEMGTDHPRLDWSPRPARIIDRSMPGPDGFGSSDPFVRSGMLSPRHTDSVAATIAAGFKRAHSAFAFTDKAITRNGHHYGFVQNGAVLSRLNPGLSTIFVLDDGSIHMRSWTEQDDILLPRVAFARQNGVPLVENGVPGEHVSNWGFGNWSGSADAQLRTLRAGACLKKSKGRDFLVYGYFSTATPSAMARVFQAYDCSYAMLLDMNSQEHSYMALYTHEDGRVIPHHVVRSMSALDGQTRDGFPSPRFVGYADNRDFFYLLRK